MARRARGGRVGDYEHEVLIRSRPRRRFGDFAAVGKVTRRPQAAKSPCENETAPLSPPHPPQCAHWGTFPPGGRLRRAATWGRPYGGNIALKNKKTLSSRDWDESVWFASWCHPISERPGRSLWTPCCGGGAAPVSRPAGGAVFGRVRLRGVLSTWGRSPVGPLSVRRYPGYSCAVVAVNADMLPYFPQKVKEMWKTYRAKGTRLGFMPMRQSRSPRARP